MGLRETASRVGLVLGISVVVVAAGLGIVLAMEGGGDDDRPIAQDDEEDESIDQEQEDESTDREDDEPIAGADGAGVRIDVLSLDRRSKEVVTLRFRLTNTSSEAVDLELGEAVLDYTAGSVYLHDTPNGKKYLSLRDTDGGCLCSRLEAGEDLEPGDEKLLYVEFPAPPEDVESVAVGVPDFGVVDNVEISG